MYELLVVEATPKQVEPGVGLQIRRPRTEGFTLGVNGLGFRV